MFRHLAKVHPRPYSPSTLVQKVNAYLRAGQGENLDESRADIIEILMDIRKMTSMNDLMQPVYKILDQEYSLFFASAVLWSDVKLVKAVISTSKRLGGFEQLKRVNYKRPLCEVVSDEIILDLLEREGFCDSGKGRSLRGVRGRFSRRKSKARNRLKSRVRPRGDLR